MRVSAKRFIARVISLGDAFSEALAKALRASPLLCFLGTCAQNSSKSVGAISVLSSGFESFLSFVPLAFRNCFAFWEASVLVFFVITDSNYVNACFSVGSDLLVLLEAF